MLVRAFLSHRFFSFQVEAARTVHFGLMPTKCLLRKQVTNNGLVVGKLVSLIGGNIGDHGADIRSLLAGTGLRRGRELEMAAKPRCPVRPFLLACEGQLGLTQAGERNKVVNLVDGLILIFSPDRTQPPLSRMVSFSARHPLVVAIPACALALLGAWYAAHSLYLAFVFSQPLVVGDQWAFVHNSYLPYVDGHLRALDLFQAHNEHRIFTTQLVLLTDAILFKMRGTFAILVNYAAMAAITFLLVRCAQGRAGGKLETVVGFAIALGMAWSLASFWNLAFPFHVCFALVHLCAAGVYLTLSRALLDKTAARYSWLAIACAIDFLGIYSLGSGPFILLPAIALAIMLRGSGRILLFFSAFHVAVAIPYFINLSMADESVRGVLAPSAYCDFVVTFLGIPFGPMVAQWGGPLVLLAATATAVGITVAVVRAIPIDRSIAVLFALCLFALTELILTSYTRARYGVAWRYVTVSVVCILTLLAIAWRTADVCRPISARCLVLVAAGFVLIASNQQVFEAEWTKHAELVRRT